MGNTLSSNNHSSNESAYWNRQGVEYLIGKNKAFSIENSIRCFEKSFNLGDNIALHNLALLYLGDFLEEPLNQDSRIIKEANKISENSDLSDSQLDSRSKYISKKEPANAVPKKEPANAVPKKEPANAVPKKEPANDISKIEAKYQTIEEKYLDTCIVSKIGFEKIIISGLAAQVRIMAESVSRKFAINKDDENFGQWIYRARKKGMISMREFNTLNDIREYGNSGVHPDDTIVVSKQKIHEWTIFIDRLDQKLTSKYR